MRILLIEDEKKTAAYLAKGLGEAGFQVMTASDGESGLDVALARAFDLFIIDIMLPKRDGWSIVATLKRREIRTPILLLTARDSVRDRVKGLELGADDYLVTPFAFSELLARVRSVLRRGSARQPEIIEVADLEIDVPRHRVKRAGKRIDLSPKEFCLLSLFARRAGEVLSRT